MANQYLDYLIDPNFQGVNRFFVLTFENINDRIEHRQYFLPTRVVKDYNVKKKKKIFFYQSIKNNLRTYNNI